MKRNLITQCTCSKSINNKASYSTFLFLRHDHAIWLVPQKESASIPRTLVFSSLLLQDLSGFLIEVYQHIAIVLNATIYVLDTLLLVEWNSNQIYAPPAKTWYFTDNLTLF